ncbi:transporter substrate-binding domain-containing protein [Spirillospora sp. NPDC029432]|uniref:transporter substrate-binding domain-containing protein n=1 Tax=Spirillospora sp. NPDC029432 TaxID=3154599 RepID=UPI003455ADA6
MSVPTPRRLALGTAAVALTLAAATACGGDEGATVQGVKLIKKGSLTSCTHLPYPPFQEEKGGKVVGFDVDMIDLVAKKLGVTHKIVDTPFETMKTGSALNAGKCDIVMGGMTITPDRTKFMDVSKPYFDATQALLAKKDSGITSLDDVKTKKLKLGSQASTTGEDFVKGKGFDPRSFDNSTAELDGLRTGQVDVIVQDDPVVRVWLKDPATAAKYSIVANLETGEQYGFWIRKGHNPKLVELTNQVIAETKANGTYKQMYEKWLGPMPKTDGSGGGTP